MILFLTALAGGLGAICRFIVDGAVNARRGDHVPGGTFVVNVVGSFVLGWCVAALVRQPEPHLILGTGFCGGFTTFSTAMLESARLCLAGRRWEAIGLTFSVLVGSLLAAAAGYWLG